MSTYPTTGYWRPVERTCKCGEKFTDALYVTCENCRDAWVLFPAVRVIRAEWKMDALISVMAHMTFMALVNASNEIQEA